MLKQERHRRILELLRSDGRLVASELPHKIGVSGHTVRRDLAEIARRFAVQAEPGKHLPLIAAAFAVAAGKI